MGAQHGPGGGSPQRPGTDPTLSTAEPCPEEETVLHCQNPDCAGERRATKVGPAGCGQRRAAAAWGLGGEKGQRTALPNLPLPALVGSSWPAMPGVYSLLVSRSC